MTTADFSLLLEGGMLYNVYSTVQSQAKFQNHP